MAKLNVSNPLAQGGNPPVEVSMEQVASTMYDGLELPVSLAPKPKMISVDEIARDITQPRRILSERLRDAGSVGDVILRWHEMSEDLLREPINVRALINKRGEANEDEKAVHGIAKNFLSVVALAGDILRDGLINSITVIRLAGGGYKIETGERRWWAYQFLRVYTGDAKWDAIPATVSDKGQSVWRTAGENASREELNAIGKARQFALIVMHLNKDRDGVAYYDYDFFDHDRLFYAQVANGNLHPVPENQVKAVCDAVGVNGGKARLSQIRRLLRELSNEQWEQFDEENTPERVIREVIAPTQTPERLTMVNLADQNNADDTLTGVNTSPKPSPIPHPKIGLQNAPYQSQTPPQPPMVTPKPSPLQYNPRPPMPDLEEDDEVLDSGDGEPMVITHPFGGITSHDGGMGHPHDIAPSALENEQLMDYQSLLKSFLSTAGRDVAGDMSVLTRGHIRKMREQYTSDEIAQILTGWENEIGAIMEKIWSEAQAFNGMVYDIASKMKGVGDGE